MLTYSDLGLYIELYNLEPSTKFTIKKIIGYQGGNAERRINECIKLKIIVPNGTNTYSPNKKMIRKILRQTEKIRILLNIIEDDKSLLEKLNIIVRE